MGVGCGKDEPPWKNTSTTHAEEAVAQFQMVTKRAKSKHKGLQNKGRAGGFSKGKSQKKRTSNRKGLENKKNSKTGTQREKNHSQKKRKKKGRTRPK